MPRQGWETNKAGGKGPAAAEEGDKSQPQPACPVQPAAGQGPRGTAQPGPWGCQLRRQSGPAAGTSTRRRSPAGAARSRTQPPRAPGARWDLAHGASELWHPRACWWPWPGPAVGPGSPPSSTRPLPRGVRLPARAGRPGRQMDGSSASIPHPFSPRQTPSDFHKSKRHTV